MSYIIVNKFEDFDFKKIRIGVPKRVNSNVQIGLGEDCLFSEIRYIDQKDNGRKQLYIQGPDAILGNLQWEAPDSMGQVNLAYLDMYVIDEDKKTSKSSKFCQLVNNLDIYMTKKIWETRHRWSLDEKTPMIKIEKNFVPTLGLSSLNCKRQVLRFAIPVKAYGNTNYLDTSVYDQENDELPLSLLKPEYPSKSLLHIKGLLKQGEYYSLVLELKQLKVEVPEQVFDSCQLSASEDDEIPKTIYDLYEEYE